MNKPNTIVKQAPPAGNQFRLGLEKFKLKMFESTDSTFNIPFMNGAYNHGLTPDEQKIVEDFYGLKFDNPEDKDQWGNMIFTVKHTINAYNTDTSPEDLLVLSVMVQLGLAARSLDEMKENPMNDYAFVITNDNQETEAKATLYEKTDTAIVELSKLKTSKKHLLAIAGYLVPRSFGIGENVDRAYLKLREFIEGAMTTSKAEGLSRFADALNLEKEYLYTVVDFREAVAKNIVRKNNRKYFYNPLTDVEYGKNEEEAINFLTNPKHQSELGTGGKSDENYSIRSQLKNR